MSLGSHPLIANVLDAGGRFRAGQITISEFQNSVSAAMSALEGDVPAVVKNAMFQLEAGIDSARFTVDEGKRPAEVDKALLDFEAVIAEASGR